MQAFWFWTVSFYLDETEFYFVKKPACDCSYESSDMLLLPITGTVHLHTEPSPCSCCSLHLEDSIDFPPALLACSTPAAGWLICLPYLWVAFCQAHLSLVHCSFAFLCLFTLLSRCRVSIVMPLVSMFFLFPATLVLFQVIHPSLWNFKVSAE